MSRRDDLMEMTKTNLINVGSSLNPPLLLTMDHKKGDMVEHILKSEPGGTPISVDAEAPTPAEQAQNQPNKQDERAIDLPRKGRLFDLQGNAWEGDYYQIKVFATETDRGMVEPQINGHAIRFRRGITVVVPEPYVRLLQQATSRVEVKDPETNEPRMLEVQQYPMQIEGPVPGPTRVVA